MNDKNQVIKFKRLTGSTNFWNTIYNKYIKLCNHVLTGLSTNSMNDNETKLLYRAFPRDRTNRRKQKNQQLKEKEQEEHKIEF